MDIVKEFFKQNPDVPKVLKVGDNLFLSNHIGAASDYANRTGGTVETVNNPRESGISEADAKKAEADAVKKAADAAKAAEDEEAKKLAGAGVKK